MTVDTKQEVTQSEIRPNEVSKGFPGASPWPPRANYVRNAPPPSQTTVLTILGLIRFCRLLEDFCGSKTFY